MKALPPPFGTEATSRHTRLTDLALFLLGAVATLGWSPLDQAWLTWLAFAVLVVCIAKASGPLQALVHCFCFALGLHVFGHGWIFPALLHQTRAGPVWSLLGSALFLIYLSLFLAIPASLCKWLWARTWARSAGKKTAGGGALMLFVVLLAVAWSAGEAARGHFFNGFDSLAAGYLFSGNLLRGWVPVLGAYGCSLLFYASAGLAGAAWVVRKSSRRSSAVAAALLPLIILACGAWLDTQPWVKPAGAPLSFRLIQEGIPQQQKFDSRRRDSQVSTLVDAISAARADLIVTPETAFPVDLTEIAPARLAKLRAFSSSSRSNIFLGMFHVDGQGGVRNSVVQVAPGNTPMQRYDKTLLMPFGEYAPAGLGWFAARLSVARSNLTPGRPDQSPLIAHTGAGDVKVGALLCNEALSNSDARQWARRIGLFINPSNLAWFAGTVALPQQLQVVQIRALETGRPILRATNTGVTAYIDEKGRVVSRLPENRPAVMEGFVQPTRGLTPFVRFGHLPTLALAALLLAGAALASWIDRRRVSRADTGCD